MGGVRDIVVPCPTLGQGFWEKPVQKTQGLTAKNRFWCAALGGGENNGGSGQGLVVGDLVSVWLLGCGVLFWGWFVVMCAGQQKSEGGERKQE